MVKEVEQTEGSVRDVKRQPPSFTKPKNEADDKTWLLKTEDFQIWGPFSLNELFMLARNKKLSRSDYVAKSCGSFERIEVIAALKEVVDLIPDTIFDEETDNNIVRDFAEEPTIKDTVGSSWRFFLNLSIIPLNTFLWVVLFILVTSYCLYYVSTN